MAGDAAESQDDMTLAPTTTDRSVKRPVERPATRWRTIDELCRALGDIPRTRILFDPVPGTATERDLLAKVEREDLLVELVYGTLVEKPMGRFEDIVGVQIASALASFVTPRKLGWVNGAQGPMRMSLGNVRLPDAAYTAIQRLSARTLRDEKVSPVSPDLVVEVLSESNRRSEMDKKRIEYFASGTRLVWEVDPKKETFALYTNPHAPDAVLTRSATLTGGKVLPGFRLKLEKFWSQFDVDE